MENKLLIHPVQFFFFFFFGGHTSDRYFMWWLFFYHLSEIKWIFHLSEIIVHYRKDFSQNKRGQSEHRLTGEVKPTGLFYFSNSRFVYTDDSLAHFLLPKQLFPTLHFPLCRCTFMVKFLQHQKYAIHARRLRLLRLKKKKKKDF